METLVRTFNESKTKKEFKQVRRIYDGWSRLTERKALKRVLQLAAVQDGSTVIDVACGTGELLMKLAEQNPGGTTIGVDLSPAMLDKARRKLEHNSGGNVELREGNALALDFPDNTFDVLCNTYMVDLMPAETFDRLAAEFHRILAPGGRVVISTFSFGTKKIHRFWYWMAKRFPGLLTECRPVSFSSYLKHAGFKVKETDEISQNTFPSQVIAAVKKSPS